MLYLDSLSTFSGHAITETKRNEFKNELIQYHLLLFYFGYLDQYEQQLTHMALYGFSASFLGALALFGARQVGLLP